MEYKKGNDYIFKLYVAYKKGSPYWLPFLPLFNVESETVFTTCIYNNIGYGHKMPHSIDTDS